MTMIGSWGLGMTPAFKDALLSLDDGTPCRMAPDNWSTPATPSVCEMAKSLCGACPIVDQCLRFGRDTDATGVFGGHYLHCGEIVDEPRLSQGRRSDTKSQERAFSHLSAIRPARKRAVPPAAPAPARPPAKRQVEAEVPVVRESRTSTPSDPAAIVAALMEAAVRRSALVHDDGYAA